MFIRDFDWFGWVGRFFGGGVFKILVKRGPDGLVVMLVRADIVTMVDIFLGGFSADFSGIGLCVRAVKPAH